MDRTNVGFVQDELRGTWGLVIVAMCFIHNVWMFYGLRFLLDVAEAGLFPGVLLYFTQ
ncbi:hypothetical protein ACWD26_36150 [Streptomyces sp. NPDC002787]